MQQLKVYSKKLKSYPKSPRHEQQNPNMYAHSPNPRQKSPNPHSAPYLYSADDRNGALKGSRTNGQMFLSPPQAPLYPNMLGYNANDLRRSFAQSPQAPYPQNLSKSWSPNFNGYPSY
jgi:hypothetical protein